MPITGNLTPSCDMANQGADFFLSFRPLSPFRRRIIPPIRHKNPNPAPSPSPPREKDGKSETPTPASFLRALSLSLSSTTSPD